MANTQIYKYTNTQYREWGGTVMLLIKMFNTLFVCTDVDQGRAQIQFLIFLPFQGWPIHKYKNTQIYKYTNTQRHKYTNTVSYLPPLPRLAASRSAASWRFHLFRRFWNQIFTWDQKINHLHQELKINFDRVGWFILMSFDPLTRWKAKHSYLSLCQMKRCSKASSLRAGGEF